MNQHISWSANRKFDKPALFLKWILETLPMLLYKTGKNFKL